MRDLAQDPKTDTASLQDIAVNADADSEILFSIILNPNVNAATLTLMA